MTERKRWIDVVAHAVRELEALDDETAQVQAAALRELFDPSAPTEPQSKEWREQEQAVGYRAGYEAALAQRPAAQQEPLTDEQINVILHEQQGKLGEPWFLQFARAIEAAHGIKESKT